METITINQLIQVLFLFFVEMFTIYFNVKIGLKKGVQIWQLAIE